MMCDFLFKDCAYVCASFRIICAFVRFKRGFERFVYICIFFSFFLSMSACVRVYSILCVCARVGVAA